MDPDGIGLGGTAILLKIVSRNCQLQQYKKDYIRATNIRNVGEHCDICSTTIYFQIILYFETFSVFRQYKSVIRVN